MPNMLIGVQYGCLITTFLEHATCRLLDIDVCTSLYQYLVYQARPCLTLWRTQDGLA